MRARYQAKPVQQKLRFQGHLIGCTDTSFVMAVDAATLGGCIVTEALVRKLSNESHPDPESPGLNLGQLEDVADKLHVQFTPRRGANRADMAASLRANKRVVAQLWYAGIGGTPIGHAVYVESITKRGTIRGVDPMKGKYQEWPQEQFFGAMRTFAAKVGVDGLLWGETRSTQWLSANQKPAAT